jgi:hypothetical protein
MAIRRVGVNPKKQRKKGHFCPFWHFDPLFAATIVDPGGIFR